MSREQIYPSKEPRTDALNFVTNNGKHTLHVDDFIDAGRPSGGDPHHAYATHYTSPSGNETYASAKKGVTGHVIETGQSFTIRDDFDFANAQGGKGYHVNAQLGKTTAAFTSGQDSAEAYYDRTNMTGERVYFDGKAEAARWYTQGYSR